MAEPMAKFKEMIDGTKTVAVRAGNTGDITKTLCAAILHNLFLKLNKRSSLDLGEAGKNIREYIEIIFPKYLERENNLKISENILIKLDTSDIPVSEMRYEKDGNMLKIILSPKEPATGTLNAKNISVSKEKVPVDLLMLVDPPESELERMLNETPHKDVVKLTSKDKELPLKLWEISSALSDEPEIFKEAFWLLLEEHNKTRQKVSKGSLELSMRILDFSPDFQKISAAKAAFFNSGFWKLVGRALSRSEFEKEIFTTWSFLPKSDFEKTNQDNDSALAVFETMRGVRGAGEFFTMLWETETGGKKNIRAFIGSENQEKLKTLASLFSTSPSSSYFSVGGFINFSEAELKIRDMIKKVL